jgi:U6 snRNA-associated Sm-like protein LSm6
MLDLTICVLFSLLGTLSCLDGYMNVAMENTKEMVDGNVTASFGDAFIRGNNG